MFSSDLNSRSSFTATFVLDLIRGTSTLLITQAVFFLPILGPISIEGTFILPEISTQNVQVLFGSSLL